VLEATALQVGLEFPVDMVCGSLLSVGSAAGVALMGQARGFYTFFSHLRWTPAIALGYALSIWVHFLINARFVNVPVP